MLKWTINLAVALCLVATASVARAANEFEPQMRAAFEQMVKGWLGDPVIVEAIKAQNEKNAALSAADIDALDKQWRAEAKDGKGTLIDSVLANAVSKLLGEKKAASGELFTEMFIMDNKGLNVGQSDVTSDYMQGDEAKWEKTFLVGPDAVFIDDVEFDDSAGTFQAQMSATISDPATGKAIGAITIGMNVEKL